MKTILFIISIFILSSCTVHTRCATYGYKRVYVNGKKSYIDPVHLGGKKQKATWKRK